jgi:predicted  nucleic acid-binding Zn-ribbon protein
MEIVVSTLTALLALLLGAFVTKLFSDSKLTKLGEDLKIEIKQTKVPIEELSKSVLELDRRVVQLIERFSRNSEEIANLERLTDEIFTRLREVESTSKVHDQRIFDILEGCKRFHDK